ncbi:piggyBac transposable element-derived protein 1-like [Centruroides sculpturatus]|uniref:piggyBac transposable element-derived protein 1-like n=1 Tax=Centruroides sculpturatus TaxID=218467 RepID=UPI000C6DA9D9|nr:piggyBac transposable element-derived protein 1-like [Centruroides sculpturatus]
MPCGLTIKEALTEYDNYEVDEDDMSDLELTIIPPPPDELKDKEDIEENTLTDSVVRDVAGTLELITPSDKHDDSPCGKNENKDGPLAKKNLKAAGTIRETHSKSCPLMNSKRMEKEKERGFYDHQFDKENEILLVKWRDNKPVCIATNFSAITPVSSVKRYSQQKKKEINIPMPKLFQEYNTHMEDVDLLDKQDSLYRIRVRSKKW